MGSEVDKLIEELDATYARAQAAQQPSVREREWDADDIEGSGSWYPDVTAHVVMLLNAYPRLSAAARGWAGLEGLAKEFENEGEKYDESCSATQFVQWLRAREQKENGTNG